MDTKKPFVVSLSLIVVTYFSLFMFFANDANAATDMRSGNVPALEIKEELPEETEQAPPPQGDVEYTVPAKPETGGSGGGAAPPPENNAGIVSSSTAEIHPVSTDVPTVMDEYKAQREMEEEMQANSAADADALMDTLDKELPTPEDLDVQEEATEPPEAPDGGVAGGAFDANGFVFADSHERYLTETELHELANRASNEYPLVALLGCARNEIFARRGHQFDSEFYASHYSQYDWYQALPPRKVDHTEFNQFETSNIETIKQVENSLEHIAIWQDVECSSFLNKNDKTYPATNMIDNDPTTIWAEGADGDGIGEWVLLNDATAKDIRGVEIINGYAKDAESYADNNRIKKVRLSFSDGTSVEAELEDGKPEYQRALIPLYKRTNFIKIEILEVYAGAKHNNTCIAEIRVVEVGGDSVSQEPGVETLLPDEL